MRAEELSHVEEVIERWRDHGRRIYAALDDTDYDRVAVLVDERDVLLSQLESVASEIDSTLKLTLLTDEDQLQAAIDEHYKQIEGKLSGVGRMRLGMRKYKME
jgi:hypothetical protein